MPTAKKKKVQPAVRSKNSSAKSNKQFWKTPVGVAILITLLVAALVFITGKTQEDQSAVETMSKMKYPTEQLQNSDDKMMKADEDENEAEDADEADETEDADESPAATTGY